MEDTGKPAPQPPATARQNIDAARDKCLLRLAKLATEIRRMSAEVAGLEQDIDALDKVSGILP